MPYVSSLNGCGAATLDASVKAVFVSILPDSMFDFPDFCDGASVLPKLFLRDEAKI